MESELRELLGKYGYQAVKEYLDSEMLKTYQYLNSYFKNTKHKSRENSQSKVENVVVTPVDQVREIILTSDVAKENLDFTEKTVSLANSTITSSKQKKTKQMALTKVPESTPEPAPTSEVKPKKKYYYKKKT